IDPGGHLAGAVEAQVRQVLVDVPGGRLLVAGDAPGLAEQAGRGAPGLVPRRAAERLELEPARALLDDDIRAALLHEGARHREARLARGLAGAHRAAGQLGAPARRDRHDVADLRLHLLDHVRPVARGVHAAEPALAE